MTEQKPELPHKLTLSQRKQLTVTGVTEVVSFEEDGAVLKTTLGILIVQGQQLKLKTLSLEGGQVGQRVRILLVWCGRRDLNPHTQRVSDFKSEASADSATAAHNCIIPQLSGKDNTP